MSEKVYISSDKIRVGIVTISDKCFAGITEDLSGALIKDIVNVSSEFGAHALVVDRTCVPDDIACIKSVLQRWSDVGMLDVILTTGGTGVSPRDVTAMATEQILDRKFLGISIALIASSLSKSPYAMAANPVCGVRKNTLIINLPGSTKGCLDYLRILSPVIQHILDLIKDNKKSVDKKHQEIMRENVYSVGRETVNLSLDSNAEKVVVAKDITKHRRGDSKRSELKTSVKKHCGLGAKRYKCIGQQLGSIESSIHARHSDFKKVRKDSNMDEEVQRVCKLSPNYKEHLICKPSAKEKVSPVCELSLKDDTELFGKPSAKEKVPPICESPPKEHAQTFEKPSENEKLRPICELSPKDDAPFSELTPIDDSFLVAVTSDEIKSQNRIDVYGTAKLVDCWTLNQNDVELESFRLINNKNVVEKNCQQECTLYRQNVIDLAKPEAIWNTFDATEHYIASNLFNMVHRRDEEDICGSVTNVKHDTNAQGYANDEKVKGQGDLAISQQACINENRNKGRSNVPFENESQESTLIGKYGESSWKQDDIFIRNLIYKNDGEGVQMKNTNNVNFVEDIHIPNGNALSKIDECLGVMPAMFIAPRIVFLMSEIAGLCPRIATFIVHRAMTNATQHDICIDVCSRILKEPYKTPFEKYLQRECFVQFGNIIKRKNEIQLVNKLQQSDQDQLSKDGSIRLNSSTEPDLDVRCQNLARFIGLFEERRSRTFAFVILYILEECCQSATAVRIELATVLLAALPSPHIKALEGHDIFKTLLEVSSKTEIFLSSRIGAMVQNLLLQKEKLECSNLRRSYLKRMFPKVETEDENWDTPQIRKITENQTTRQLRNYIRNKITNITVNLKDALFRKVAKNIYASEPFPSYPVSMKDGYAVISREGRGVRKVTGYSVAESIPGGVELSASSAIRVTTGAPIPVFADAVVQVEDTILISMSQDCKEECVVDIRKAPIPGQDIRKIGADVNKGDLVLRAGAELGPCELGILAMYGINRVDVFRDPKVALLFIDTFDYECDVLRFLTANKFQPPAYILHFKTKALSREMKNIVPKIDNCDVTLLFAHHCGIFLRETVAKYSKEKTLIYINIGLDGAASEKVVHCDALRDVVPKIICVMPVYEINVALETCVDPILRSFYGKNGHISV